MGSFYRLFVLFFVLVHQGSCALLSSEEILKAFDTVNSVSEQAYLAINEWPPAPFKEVLISVIDNARPCEVARRERYSRADGVCNNLFHPFSGAALGVHRRLFTNAYLDGTALPRTQTESGQNLPYPIEISHQLTAYSRTKRETKPEDRQFAQLMENFGRFLSKDITLMGEVDEEVDCCNVDKPCLHADDNIKPEDECFPMADPAGRFESNETCINFTRSFAATVCAVREQINLGSSFIDASNVYGPSTIHQRQIRVGTQGQLDLQLEQQFKRIGVKGELEYDSAALRALFQSEHNRIARKLFLINPLWDDERTFQETRKIMIAIMQKIVYEDYLPLVVGNDVIRIFHLDGYFVYDNSIDPSAITEFATVVLKFAGVSPADREYGEVKDETFAFDFLSRLANSTIAKSNSFERLGGDPIWTAEHIQRGRDHGIPPYTVVRDACRHLLEDIPGVIQDLETKFDDIYSSEEDIDLFVGGASETSLEGAHMGPTFACVTGLQFQRLKFGDRFFYDGGLPEGFEEVKRDFIRRNTLAALMCELDETKSLQRNVFGPVSESNPLTPCRVILNERNLDAGLELWRNNLDQRDTRRRFVSFDLSIPCDE